MKLSRVYRIGAASLACAVLVDIACPPRAANSEEIDGVSMTVRAVPNSVVFCIAAREPLKISSEYGVQFQVEPRDWQLWDEHFPKTVTAPGWYFALPLRIKLVPRGDVQQHTINVDLGACSEATGCNAVRFAITIPSYESPTPRASFCGS
jgi:hypothetical protein